MARIGVIGLSAGMAVVMGAIVPIITIYYMAQGLEVIAGVIVILFSLTGGVVLGVVSMGIGFAAPFAGDSAAAEAEERLKVLRASHRALLEELDDEVAILKEIRDNLKNAGGGRA